MYPLQFYKSYQTAPYLIQPNPTIPQPTYQTIPQPTVPLPALPNPTLIKERASLTRNPPRGGFIEPLTLHMQCHEPCLSYCN
jgi:hypothetical protein